MTRDMPKTFEQEKLEGYPGHRPKNTGAPVPNRDIPPPPKWMGRISTRAYHDFVRTVGPDGMNVMAQSDRIALVMTCEAFAEWRECKKIVDLYGRYQESKGVFKRHPAVVDMQNAWNRIMVGLGKFGMTPYERQKVTVLPEEKREETREEKMARRRANAARRAKENNLRVVNE